MAWISRKNLAAIVLRAVGAAALARHRHRGRLAILMYHGIEPAPLSPACWHVLDTAALRRQLTYLRRHFHVLPLDEALERLQDGTLPDRAVSITFDDGTRNLATHAAPVLDALGLPAAVFLATGPMGSDEALWPDRLWLAFTRTKLADVDLTQLGLGEQPLASPTDRGSAYALTVNRLKELPDEQRAERLRSIVTTLRPEGDGDPGPFRLLSWQEAHGMAANGSVTLHPHSVTHPILSRCSNDKIHQEISNSCAILERETGFAPRVFAYPNGRAQDFDERARAALRGRGVRWALATIEGFADRHSDPLALPRLAIGSDLSFASFCAMVSGVSPRRRSDAASVRATNTATSA
ncbi:polysaccharide deacetylase family protein [Mycobacterium sp. CVI_P3]|uniref:Polysaccharide deacetylase family protein n=1 Tax=Mycobacterium pinniadriaticum TaxID=2994102 RepID=A0ABT3SAR5_9MYCO|nr:polysaccharide deacetylase family protein [Mycobacterium pinniadriaticum]MCX2930337.1 polysaccharide deacetylase family protein [Mycobacterium pinniadriaticum]MCX2936601.1 polysaccharide deacetylase family protein [Mycobacterium pinniadriaticum]